MKEFSNANENANCSFIIFDNLDLQVY